MAQNTKLAGYNAGATPLTGVNPVHTIQFGVCITGRKSTDTPETVETKVVKDAESLSISVDGTIEEWNPMDQAGWTRRLTTGKSLGMTMGGKRNYGDEGNDYIASLALKTGQECNTWVSIIFPNLDQLLIPAVINVTSLGGDSTSIDALAAGVTLAAVDTPILFSSAVIGITAFLFSFGGVFIGKKFGGFLGSKAECIGGIILILIGVKTLVEHLY